VKLISRSGKIGAIDEQELKALILLQMKSVMDMIVDDILKLLKKNIDKKVYNAFSPVKYERLGDNGGLRDLWQEEKSKIVGGRVVGEVKESPERLILNQDNFQHGSKFKRQEGWYESDIRDALAEIVIEGKSGDLFGEGKWRKPRDFWNPLLKDLKDDKINQIIEKAFRKHKIKFIRIY